MPRIDLYLSHLVREDAEAVVLSSGAPATFRLPTGDRQSNSVVAHAQLVHLVDEIAPREVHDLLLRRSHAKFRYKGAGGVVTVEVNVKDAHHWRVVITPGDTSSSGSSSSHRKSVSPASHRKSVSPAAARKSTMPGRASKAPGRRKTAASLHAAPMPAHARLPKLDQLSEPELATAPTPTPAVVVRAAGEPAINALLRLMVKLDASDLHLTTGERPLARVSGDMRPVDPSLGVMSDADLRELLMPIATTKGRADFEATNDADFAHLIEGVARFRCNYFMERRGIGAVFRQIPFNILSPEQLGLSKHVLDLCSLSKGLVLVTGPTGSGKSTTLATLIDFVNRHRSDHIITIEDPIEFVHESKKCLVNQREVGVHTRDFKSALRAALREDPDVVLVGELRDLETIAIAIETAETGHLVFGTLHTTTAIGTVDRLIDQFPADRQEQIRTMLSESLRGVIAQMLCKKVGGGRVAAYEVLLATSAVANLIREGKTFQLTSVMQTGKTIGMQTMNEHFLALVKAGTVEPREAYAKTNDKRGLREAFAQLGLRFEG